MSRPDIAAHVEIDINAAFDVIADHTYTHVHTSGGTFRIDDRIVDRIVAARAERDSE